MTEGQTPVVVAMSGGVDSSVAAGLLVEEGYPVIGMMLRLWSEAGREAINRCCTPEAMGLARKVAAQLEIPFYVLDVRERFRQTVVEYFIEGYADGITPNPCLLCNRQIRFGLLLEHAKSLGARYLATGHYARLRKSPEGKIQLWRAVDAEKDQSYVLSVLNQEQLGHALFPIGEYTKPQVRRLAREFGLPVAQRADSQDLCFLAGDDYRRFLARNAPGVARPGPIVSHQGEVLGQHTGLAYYTIGQRKGLGVPSPVPLYVVGKDPRRNALVVEPGQRLGKAALTAHKVNWLMGAPPADPIRAQVKIRYRARGVWATISPQGSDQVMVRFDEPVRDITPGQAAVFYDGDHCLGGGIIVSAHDTD